MSASRVGRYLSQDAGLLAHWRSALQDPAGSAVATLDALAPDHITVPTLLWVDLALPDLPAWSHPAWAALLRHPLLRVVATSSRPQDAQAVAALDAGCAGYCHAYAEAATLQQVAQVVQAGHVWIGAALVQRLIQTAHQAASPQRVDDAWSQTLTAREKQVARLVAQGASNLDIARDCDISERTVKAHLSAIFEKLGIADRLQLALKVHGIR